MGDHGGNWCSNDSGKKFFVKKKKKIPAVIMTGVIFDSWIIYDCFSVKGKQTNLMSSNTQISFPVFSYVSLLQILAIFCASEVSVTRTFFCS